MTTHLRHTNTFGSAFSIIINWIYYLNFNTLPSRWLYSFGSLAIQFFYDLQPDYYGESIIGLSEETKLWFRFFFDRNFLFNVSLSGLRENKRQRIEWRSSDAHRELCTLKGKSETDCQNYIRVFARISEYQVMLCGTNSYKPHCRYYTIQPDAEQLFELTKETEAMGRCPYNPTHNSTYVFTDGQLYSATVADFSGADPLIIRDNLRTEQYDLKQLNQPAFVSAVDYGGYVFYFFREVAMEYMNCGKSIYSRVGRVCKNDKGGPYPFAERWTSFLKSRLNCSMPGEYPFYFDEIRKYLKPLTAIIGSFYFSLQSHAYLESIAEEKLKQSQGLTIQ